MTHYVYSTLTGSTIYEPAPVKEAKDFQYDEETRRILIKGGANRARSTISGGLWTPKGILTIVSDKQMEALLVNQHFINHVKNGFIKHDKQKAKTVEKGVADLEPKDKSAPYDPNNMPVPGVKEVKDPKKRKG